MKNRYKQILFLYLNNLNFMALLAIFLLTAFVSKLFYHMRFGYYAEEIFTLFFIVALWLAFQLGMVIKRQFSTHRASLLPRYRNPHINFAFVLYLVFIGVAYFWQWGLKFRIPGIEIKTHGLWAVYFTCLFIAILITYLGYLSIGRVLIYAYVFLLIFSNQSGNVISILNGANYLVYVIAAACVVFALYFRHRLLRVKEDSFEYGHIFSWPPRKFILSQIKADQRFADLISPLAKFLTFMKSKAARVSVYPRNRNIFFRSFHWNYGGRREFIQFWFLFMLITPLYLFFVVRQHGYEGFFQKIDTNFLLLAITPIAITLGTHYKYLSYLEFDVIKPVMKDVLIKERGIVLLIHLVLNWFLFALCYAVVPGIFLQPGLLVINKFWGTIALTGTFAFVVFSWISVLSCVNRPASVIAQGFLLSCLILFQFYFAPYFSWKTIVINNILCLILGSFLIRRAYKMWCQKEF